MYIIKKYLNKIGNVEKLSINDFLLYSKNSKFEDSEKLRHLAIAMETEYYPDNLFDKWNLLKIIYSEALKINPLNKSIYDSFIISGLSLIETEENKELNLIIFSDCKNILSKAKELSLDNSNLEYAFGLLSYTLDLNSEEFFETSLKLNPDNYMTRMYLGHVYFDKNEYNKALKEFEKVNILDLKKNFPKWRLIKLKESIGVCVIRTGKTEEGIIILKEIIKEYNHKNSEVNLSYPSEMLQVLEEYKMICLIKNSKIERLRKK